MCFEGEEVLADSAGGQVGFAGELVGCGFAEGLDGHDDCLAGGAQVLEAAAVWRIAHEHGGNDTFRLQIARTQKVHQRVFELI